MSSFYQVFENFSYILQLANTSHWLYVCVKSSNSTRFVILEKQTIVSFSFSLNPYPFFKLSILFFYLHVSKWCFNNATF